MLLGKMMYFQIVSLVHPGVKMVTKELSRKPDKRLLKSVNGYQRTLRSLCCVLGQDGGGGEGVILLWISILFRS